MTIRQDFRDAFRQLRRNPGFTVAAVVSLALGIGANTAIFSLLDQVLLRPLPVEQPEQLVSVKWNGTRYGVTMQGDTLSYPAYRYVRDQNQVFSGVLCRFRVPLSVGYRGQTERVAGELVSGNYFDVLRIRAALGRTLTPLDDRVAGGHPLAVLNYDYWVTRFAGDPSILGRAVVVDGRPLTIVGVAQRGFDGIELGYSPRLWIPVAMKAQMTQGWFSESVTLENRRTYWVQVFARLKPGITADAAQASLQPGFRAMLESELREPGFENAGPEERNAFLRSSIAVAPGSQGRTSLRDGYERPLQLLMAVVGLVLLIACANVANLLLERATSRKREVAVRMALGARTSQIVRHALVESVLLAMIGGAAGLLLATWTTDALIQFVPTDDARVNLATTPDWRVLAFTFIVCIATGLLFGLAPALAASRVEAGPTLKRDSRAITGGRRWFRTSLVVAQVAMSLVLAIGAGQFLRTLTNLRRVDSGLRSGDVLVFTVNPSLNGYNEADARAFYRTLLDRLRTTPGVDAVGASAIRVLDDDWWGGAVAVDGEPPVNDDSTHPSFNLVSPGYLEALGIPLLAGRDFSEADAARTGRVALVNESFVRRYFNGRSPIGRRIGLGPHGVTPTDIEIVGVVKDAKYTTIRDEINPQAFLDDDQNPQIQEIHVYLRTSLAPEQMYAVVRKTVQGLDVNVPVTAMRTMAAQADMTLARERLVTTLTSAFGLLATVLAAVGVYALMAFNVTRRTREIGIRVALGATRGNVVRLVFDQVVMMFVIGTALAIPIAWSLAWLVRSELYGVQPFDAISTGAAVAALLAAAALAAFVPARRAAAIDPIEALRID